eukprot:COSAG04_NODE_348_length_16121_cov_7.375172_15_plen_100_part_00
MPSAFGHTGDPACFTPGKALEVSAYRFHEEDPLAFDGGVRLVWRIADILNYDRNIGSTWRGGASSPKCWIEGPVNAAAGDQGLEAAPTTVSSYVWVYTW